MKSLLLLIILVLSNHAQSGFEPPVIIDPPNPQEGDMVRIGLFERFYPPCLLIPKENSIGETHSLEIYHNVVTVNVLTDTFPLCNPFPADPAPRVYYELGKLPEGEYIVDVNYIPIGLFSTADIPPFPLPPQFHSEDFGSPIQITISSGPKPVNSLSLIGLLILVILFLFTHFIYRKN